MKKIASKQSKKANNQVSKTEKKTPHPTFKEAFTTSREKTWARKVARRSKRISLHQSFHRSYHEDYDRPLEVPGLLSHALTSFGMIFKNWRTFVPLMLCIVFMNVILVGLMSEETYQSFQDVLDAKSYELAGSQIGQVAKASLLLISTVATGGLTNGMSEVQQVFAILLFLVTWLATIYLVRHLLAKHRVKMRDGLYNALTPLISTLVVVGVVFLELIPVFIVIITYSAAVATDFLSTPFYALVYFIFAALLALLSLYLLSSSVVGLVAVTAPGIYPMVALRTTSNLVYGRRIKLLVRLLFLVVVLAICWVLVMLPIILLDLWLKSSFEFLGAVPFVSFMMLCMTVFTTIYIATYLYLYYRRMLDYAE